MQSCAAACSLAGEPSLQSADRHAAYSNFYSTHALVLQPYLQSYAVPPTLSDLYCASAGCVGLCLDWEAWELFRGKGITRRHW